MTQVLHSATVETPVGPFSVVASDDGVHVGVFTADHEVLADYLPADLQDREIRQASDLGEVTGALNAYLAGELTTLDRLPVVERGRPFTVAALRAMRNIPAGQTLSYRELAARAGQEKAVRAAGTACATNRVALIIPCHRIIRSDGGIGGYGGGLPVKRWLLQHEGVEGFSG